MDALVMCGGRGTRLDVETEKPLYEIGSKPMIERVYEALETSAIETIHAVGSPTAEQTLDWLDEPVITAPGEGYVADLQYALKRVETPVLTVAADLPLLVGDAIDRVLEVFDGDSLTVCVPVALKRSLGVRVDTTMKRRGTTLAPTGVNVVSDQGTDDVYVTHDIRFAVNVNRRSDASVAEDLL